MLQLFKSLSQKLFQTGKQTVVPQLAPLLMTIWIGGLAVAAIALWGFAEIARSVWQQETLAMDTAILRSLQSLHSPQLDQLMIGITTLGDPTILILLCGSVTLALLQRRQWSDAIALSATLGGAIGLNFWLKAVFERDRPLLWERIVNASYHSFPSGHAMVSMAVYGLLGYGLSRALPQRQVIIFSLTTLLIAAIGLSRLYLGVHWPTDVLAGYAAGLVWLVTCVLGIEAAKIHFSSRNS